MVFSPSGRDSVHLFFSFGLDTFVRMINGSTLCILTPLSTIPPTLLVVGFPFLVSVASPCVGTFAVLLCHVHVRWSVVVTVCFVPGSAGGCHSYGERPTWTTRTSPFYGYYIQRQCFWGYFSFVIASRRCVLPTKQFRRVDAAIYGVGGTATTVLVATVTTWDTFATF